MLYFLGLIKEKECLMLPLITVQIVACAFLGLLVIVWWIGTLLAFFDLVYYKSLISFLSTKEFYVSIGCILLLIFLATCKISRIFYKGFQRIEQNTYYKRSFTNGMVRSLSRSTTCKPTEI
ncbi:unnamed protein product, partial [Mesorhabditis belari]|uniref:Uncharacterized protein n=1 Tax=Mesorhabditis belari TaxID=2138241 RepID=A0AAF3J5H8_9BILA